jgi:hypothetical protein
MIALADDPDEGCGGYKADFSVPRMSRPTERIAASRTQRVKFRDECSEPTLLRCDVQAHPQSSGLMFQITAYNIDMYGENGENARVT